MSRCRTESPPSPHPNPSPQPCIPTPQPHPATPNTQGDPETLYSYGNSGPCVDVLAPGVDVFAVCASDARCGRATDSSYTWASGTSMAVRGWARFTLWGVARGMGGLVVGS